MKRLSLLVVALGVLVSACGSSSSTAPTTPTNPTFTANLLPANEVPAITGPEASGSGNVTITLTTTKDGAGNVTSALATFVVNLQGFPANTPINIAHIHQAPAGTTGNIVVQTGLTPGQTVLTTGGGSFSVANITVSADLASAIIANPAGFYFNVHSTLNPGGVARGQLVKVS